MRSWYEIRAAADETDIYLYDEIGLWGVTAGEFVRELQAVATPIINLRVNSPGGDVFDGIAIHTALVEHPATVNVTVDGLAASAASFLVQAGDHISMSRSATMMIHEPYGMALGDAATMAKMCESLDLMGDTIAGIYADRAGGTADDWRTLMRAETWYKAQEAVDAGLADAIAPGKPKAAAMAGRVFNLARFVNVPEWLETGAAARVEQPHLDNLHAAMGGLGTVHEGMCAMGADCPLAAAGAVAERNEAAAIAPVTISQLPSAEDIVAAVEQGLKQGTQEVFG